MEMVLTSPFGAMSFCIQGLLPVKHVTLQVFHYCMKDRNIIAAAYFIIRFSCTGFTLSASPHMCSARVALG